MAKDLVFKLEDCGTDLALAEEVMNRDGVINPELIIGTKDEVRRESTGVIIEPGMKGPFGNETAPIYGSRSVPVKVATYVVKYQAPRS